MFVEYGNLEYGAQWIHGDERNPLYDELKKLNLLDYKGEHLYDDEYVGMSIELTIVVMLSISCFAIIILRWDCFGYLFTL